MYRRTIQYTTFTVRNLNVNVNVDVNVNELGSHSCALIQRFAAVLALVVGNGNANGCTFIPCFICAVQCAAGIV